MLFCSCGRKWIMKDIDEMTDTIELLKKGIKKQLESAIVTLQLIHQYEECPKNISKMLYNQIGVLVFCNEELDKLFKYLITFPKIIAKY